MSAAALYQRIVSDLELAGEASAYQADANEPDPRYRSYGVRAAGKRTIINAHKAEIAALSEAERLQLATQLITSGYGEQQSVGLAALNTMVDSFTPDRFAEIDGLVRCLHGWSKIDEYTGSLLRDVLFAYPDPMLDLARKWNTAPDLWLRRASVVLFTRKVAASAQFTDVGLRMCENLVGDEEDLVLKGVGWSLKDMMKSDKPRLLDFVINLRKRGVSSTVTLYAIRDLKDPERQHVLATQPD